MNHRLCLALPLLLGACQLGASSRHLSIGSTEHRAAQAPVERVRVENGVGNVHLAFWDQADLHVQADVRVRDTRVTEFPEAVAERDLSVEWVNGWTVIRNAHMEADDHEDWSMDLIVHVPASCQSAELRSGVGSLTFDGDVQDLQMESGVGDLDVRGSADRLDSRSGVGSIRVHGSFANVEAETGTGSITAVSAALTRGRFETGVGNVDVQAGSGPTGDLEVTTGTGDVALVVGAGFEGQLDLSTGVGDVVVKGCPGVVVGDRVTSAAASGSLGDGPGKVSASTGVGSVQLRRE